MNKPELLKEYNKYKLLSDNKDKHIVELEDDLKIHKDIGQTYYNTMISVTRELADIKVNYEKALVMLYSLTKFEEYISLPWYKRIFKNI